MRIRIRNPYHFLIIFLLIVLVLVKYSSLTIPYFWDEAWPYATGIHLMYKNGLSLFPGAIPFEISRGHPLLFHFLSASWMKVFGNSLFVSHTFPLLISCLLIYVTYFVGKRFFSPAIGFFSALILAVQPVFVAQSSMLLPEIILPTLSLVSIYFYFSGRKLLFILSSAAMLMIKETGIILILTLLLKEVISFSSNKSRRVLINTFLLRIVQLVIPILIASVFFIIQKIKTGYFFLPLYTSGENFIFEIIIKKFIGYFSFFFIYQGRNVLSLLLVISILSLLFRKKKVKFNLQEINLIYFLGSFIILFILFSSSSYYSPRYLLNILPPFILIVCFFLFKMFAETKWIIYSSLLVISGTAIFFCIHKKTVDDHNLTYVDAIKVSEDAVKYCEQNNLLKKEIFANFLMRTYLTNPYCGYLSPGNVFSNVNYEFKTNTEYIIIKNFEQDPVIDSLIAENKFDLLKKFERSISWSAIYRRHL